MISTTTLWSGAQSTSRHTPLHILPLGDSITWGWHPEYQHNGTNGYRARLHHKLIWGRYASIDFVGSQRSGLMYDNENEGHPGMTINQIRRAMRAGLALRPNIVLVHAGTSDLASAETGEQRWVDAPGRLGALIDDVLEVCPDAVVIVAKIIQAKNERVAANVKRFNDAIPGVVRERQEKEFKVVVVDQSVVGASELVDGLHPSFAAYSHMADIWFKVYSSIMISHQTYQYKWPVR
ncbi:hypothetical protein J1614_004617 [Plenodomus biglobosus]|nr:hypothetical protein J1614_004617 [Plenodomus biglobosus]